jgi:glycosyltransferase involved in cell wall biosynthesis
MRILNVEGDYFVRSLRKLGHEVLAVGRAPGSDLRADKAVSLRQLLRLLEGRGFRPDLALWCDVCQPPLVQGLEALPCVTVGFSIDQYCNPWHVPLSAGFDIFLVAQRDYLPLFEHGRLQRRAHWFPLFCDTDHDVDPGGARDIPVSFVGTQDPPLNPMRKPFLTAFRRGAPLFATSGDYAPVFGRSRMVLNQCAVGELNFRIFQAMACGAALLTEDCGNGLTELFAPDEELYLYRRGDAAGAATLARQALASPRLAEVARRGSRAVRLRHSAQARARRIVSLVEELLREGPPRWRRDNAPLVREETARACAMLAGDLDLPLPEDLRGHFLRQAGRLSLT